MESTWALPDCQKRFVEHKYVKNLCFNQFPIKRPLFSNHLLWARASVGYSDLYQLAPEYVEEVDSLVKGKAFDILMCIHAKSLQLYPTLCNPMDCSPPGSSVHGILQARILEWVAIPFSRGSSRSRDWTWASCIAGKFFTVWAPGKPR